MTIINPYQDVDFASIPRINAISHEHIFNADQLKNAYDRGIRYFACVNYQPAIPSYPLSGWNYNYEDYASDEDLAIVTKTHSGSILSFVDANGNTINTDDLIQLPNAEHPVFAIDKSIPSPVISGHFNTLGNLFPEPGWGKFGTIAWRSAHPLFDLSDISDLFTSNLLFPGKIFGTVNHNSSFDGIKRYLSCSTIFKAMEIFNQYESKARNREMRNTYDQLLALGYRLWGTAAADWQGTIEVDRTSSETDYAQECSFNRGCNVLMIDGYDAMTNAEKSEAGLDAYIAGRFYASGLGNHVITDISIEGGYATFSVDGAPSLIKAITSKDVTIRSGNSISVSIKGISYVRFEAYYYSDTADMDFIFTNPIFFEDNKNSSSKRTFVLDLI